ncbi:Uncharacterized protein YyaL [hydrothermal vent metagenome]|uniref:Uncharacterized protein YyaL n=1 Tax=hydrothermal vent metagenome TaxID=652676 RepID=A0A3B0YR02_9ZZZZ
MTNMIIHYVYIKAWRKRVVPLLLTSILLLAYVLGDNSYSKGTSHSSPQLQNTLNNHPSPYLALHGSDPVTWQSWSNKIFERARQENKLVYVSIGYFSCHWCHVMQRESYKNPAIAAILNKNFIPVKVDRELHPALDTRLLEFIQSTRGYSGWPANVFITPEGYPLIGMVYVRPKNFRAILSKLSMQWKSGSTALRKMAKAARSKQVDPEKSKGPNIQIGLGEKYIKNLAKVSLERADDMNGGFGQKAKFPNVSQLNALLSYVRRNNNQAVKSILKLTLDRMASQGLYDHIRGGFFRYTVDTQWQTPHFEKMLYDNAQLAELYIVASQYFKNAHYEKVARDTLDFMLRDMRDQTGALIASLSALDDKGQEGGYYLWQAKFLATLLTKWELMVVTEAWSLQNTPSLQGGYLPVISLNNTEVAQKLGLKVEQVISTIAQVKLKLLHAQKDRRLPKDGKLLAAWNGLALRSFSLAGQLDNGIKYKRAAKKIRDYIVKHLWRNGNLVRSVVSSKPLGTASLQDYAQVSRGLYVWAKLYSPQDLILLKKIILRGWELFYSQRGWQLAKNMVPGFSAREALISDRALPSPSASLIQVSLKIAQLKGDTALLSLAKSALNVENNTLAGDPWWFATHIQTLYELQLIKKK